MTDENQQQQEPKPEPAQHDHICHPDTAPMQKPLATYQLDTITVEQNKASQASTNQDTTAANLLEQADKERKSCTYLEDTLAEYEYLNNCFAVYATKDIDGLKTILSEDIKKRQDFQTSFDDAIVKLKTAKQQVGKAFLLAQKLKTEIANSCNSEEVKKIRECLAKTPAKPNLDKRVEEIGKYSRRASNQVDDLSESFVKAAIINSFINLDTLNAFANYIKDSGGIYIKDIQDNVKAGQTALDGGLKKLYAALGSLSEGMQVKYKSNNTLEGWDGTVTNAATIQKFFSSNDCKADCKDINILVEEAQKSFDEKNGSSTTTTP